MKGYILVFAPPGVKLGSVVNKLAEKLEAEAKDIEEEIKDDPHTEKALRAIGATFHRPINMETVTFNLPRSEIIKLWKDAVARCLKKLEESDKPVKILSGHLIYYSGKRNEFYSVVDQATLTTDNLKPTSVLLFIDDLYDMYARLTERDQLYSHSQIESFLRKYERDTDIAIHSLPRERLSSKIIGWEIRNLLNHLSWRRLESVMAENLAYQLNNVPFLVWSVKQLTESISLWLENPESVTIYLSHPVSEPRRERNKNEYWPEFTYEVNQLQQELCEQGITLIMPTGIDELRFHLHDGQYTGYLKDRWPLIDDETKLLYSRPGKDVDFHDETLLLPKYWDFQKRGLFPLEIKEWRAALKSEVNAFLQVLVREIESQIAWRDLLFIYHTKGVMVFRPFYAKEPRPTFSGGVDAEIGLWEDLSQLGSKKRTVFIHFEEDVKLMLEAKGKRIWREFVDVVWKLWDRNKIVIDRDMVENMVQNKGNISEVENTLNRAKIAQSDKEVLREKFQEIWKKGKIDLLKKYLSNAVKVKEELIGIWILKDFEALKRESINIANFLRNGMPTGNNWEEQIENLFPDNIIERGSS